MQCPVLPIGILYLHLSLVSSFAPYYFSRQNPRSTGKMDVLASSTALPDQETLSKVLQVAVEASKKAGDIILGNAGGVEITNRKANSRDLLTLIDPLCEKVSNYRVVFLSEFVSELSFSFFLPVDHQSNCIRHFSGSRLFGRRGCGPW